MIKKRWSFLILLFLLPSVYALNFASAVRPLTSFFGSINAILNSSTVIYGVTFVLYAILLYGITSSAMRFVPLFQESRYSGINKQGKIVALAISFLSVFSMFWFGYHKSIQALLTDLLSPWGIFAGLLLALVVFLIIFLGFRDAEVIDKNKWQFFLAAAGTAMVLAGHITTNPNIQHWGWLIAFIGIIVFLISMVIKAGAGKEEREPGPQPPTPPAPPGPSPRPAPPSPAPAPPNPQPTPPAPPQPPRKEKWYPEILGVDYAGRRLKGQVREVQ